MPSTSSSEISPQKTYRLMAGMAIAILILLSVAIFSLSRLSTKPWASRPKAPDIQSISPQDLPAFEVVDGTKRVTPQSFEGKWTLLSFWSVTCPPCIEEMPLLNQLALTWQGPEFTVLTVNFDEGESLEAAKRLVQEEELDLPTVYDEKRVMKAAFAVNEYPRHFLINPDGKIVWSATGAFRWNEPEARDQLLRLMELQAPESIPDPAE